MIWTVVIIGLAVAGWGCALCLRRDRIEAEEAAERWQGAARQHEGECVQLLKVIDNKEAEIARLAAVLIEVRGECEKYHAENKRLHGIAIDKTCHCDDLHEEKQSALTALKAVRDMASNYLVALSEPQPEKNCGATCTDPA